MTKTSGERNIEIFFDKEDVASFGRFDEENNNTPKKLVARKEQQLKELGEFFNADKVYYVDHDKCEDYIIEKDGKRITLTASGTHYDGGWLNHKIENDLSKSVDYRGYTIKMKEEREKIVQTDENQRIHFSRTNRDTFSF